MLEKLGDIRKGRREREQREDRDREKKERDKREFDDNLKRRRRNINTFPTRLCSKVLQ